ncbi:MAG: flagellar basal body protein, partial [Pseudomonadota bacterium]
MTFTNALSTATSGLNAAAARASIASSNIANANTEGYSRRVAVLEERLAGADGAGVRVLTTQNARSDFLTADRQRLAAENAFSTERSTAATQLANIIGEPGSENSLFGQYARFEDSLRDAAATPESSILLTQSVDQARALAQKLNSLSEQAGRLRNDADRDIGIAVSEVNTALARLEELNGLPALKQSPEVFDERQRLIDQVNEQIPVTVQYRDTGVNLVTEGGVFLLTETASFIDFSPAGNVGRTQTLGAPLSGISVNGVDITPGGGGTQPSGGGRIGALFEARDVQAPGFQDQLDGLATDLIQRFGDDTVDPTKTVGEAGLFTDGTAVIPATTEVGIAERIQLNATVDPRQGGEVYRLRDGVGAVAPGPDGNGDQLNRLISAFETNRTPPASLGLPGTSNASNLAAQISSSVSLTDRNYSENALFAGTRLDLAVDQELSVIG